jgi:long-chain acyl-CoA synthetase
MAGFYALLKAGAVIAYAESFAAVAANAVELRPTILIGVPRFYEKAYERVMANALALPPLERRIFCSGLGALTERARGRLARRSLSPLTELKARLADLVVARKIRARLGGRLRYCVSGSAALSPKVIEFFFAIGIPVIEGYGLTETSPVITMNLPGRGKPGSVGPPAPGIEVRIGEEGEILTRGPHVMRGYYKNDEATRQAIRDGWFHTGDVGYLDQDGFLVITDRLKDLLVTAGGKKVAPQPLEAKLKSSPWISEAVLLGDGRPFVVALIVPQFERLENEAKAQQWPVTSTRELIQRPEVRAIYQGEIARLNRELAPFEQIKKFALLDRELSQEADELTPSLKVKRKAVMAHYAAEIEGLYTGSGVTIGA